MLWKGVTTGNTYNVFQFLFDEFKYESVDLTDATTKL